MGEYFVYFPFLTLHGWSKRSAAQPQTIYSEFPWPRKSDSPLNLVGTEASGTRVHMAGSSIDNRLDPLHVGAPGTVGTSVGMGDLDTKGNTLTAIITLRHFLHLPSG